MAKPKACFYLLACLLLRPEGYFTDAQDNSLTFSPSTPLCIGETVQLVCYVVSPTAQQFIDTAALMSFNDSLPANIPIINGNSFAGVDTSRYTTDLSGLNVSTDRPGIRLTITDYQASDGATNFSCHGAYSGGVVSPAIISGYPQGLAESISLSGTNARITFQILANLSISVNAILLSQFERNDMLNYNYTLEYDTSTESPDSTMDSSYTFMTEFTCDVCYKASFKAENCAGGSGTVSSGYFGLQRVHNSTGNFERSPSDPNHIEWKYRELPCGNTEENFLPEEYFNFTLINRLTGDSSNVTNSSLNLPYGFSVDIPQNIDITTNAYDLAITFIDPCFNVVIPIDITGDEDNTLTIILGVFFGLLLILLCVLITITVAFLVIWCMKRTPDKK